MPVKIEGSENIRDIFCILHDGSLISHATDGGELGLEVEIRYLAERIDPSFRKFEVRLFGVSDVQFSTWPGDLTSEVETLTDVGEIFRADLEVLEGNIKEGFIEVVCNQRSPEFAYCGGELRFRCSHAVVTDEAGRAYSIEALGLLCKGYWDDWSRRNQA